MVLTHIRGVLEVTFQKEEVETLKTMGLTSAQAKVYMALAGLGKANARTIWKNAGVARQDIYRILAELQAKGIVEKMITAPAEYKTLPIEDTFAVLLKSKSDEYKRVEKIAKKLLHRFKENHQQKGTAEEYEFTMATVKKVNKFRLEAIMRNTEVSLDIIDAWESFKRAMTVYADFNTEAVKRNIKFRFITNKPKKEEPVPEIVQTLKKIGCFELRHIPTKPQTSLLISDKKEVGICTEPANYRLDGPSLFSNNPFILAIIQDYFEMLWDKATENNI